jgi:signal transduction histidine kinase
MGTTLGHLFRPPWPPMAGLGLAFLSFMIMLTAPWWAGTVISHAIQNRTQQSALVYAQQLNAQLNAAQSAYTRSVASTAKPLADFESMTQQWLDHSADVLSVQMLDGTGQVLATNSRSDGQAPSHTAQPFNRLNLISLAHALELQSPTYSALHAQDDKWVVNLVIPHPGPSGVAYVLTLDTAPWTRLMDGHADKLFSVAFVPYLAQTNTTLTSYYLNFPEWEGLWTLKFQSTDPMLGVVQTLRPAFALITLIVLALIYAQWKNFRQQKKTEHQLQAQTRLLEKQSRMSMLGEMSASLAHEINQPLTSIANYAVAAQLQLKQISPDSSVHHLLQKINEQSLRAAQVLVAVRGMTQAEPMELAPIDLQGLVHQLQPHLQALCSQSKVQLRIHCEDNCHAQVHTILFEQVILNLVKNSIQALDEIHGQNKRIRISISKHESSVHIEVSDNGPGIASAYVPRIFDSFFTTKEQGLGIGLKLCRSVIERLNGRLTLLSNSPQGASFMIVLPLFQETTLQQQA